MLNNFGSVLLIDNYDSFTFNLVQMLEEAGCQHLDVVKHDEVTLESVKDYDKIVFSPGPDLPYTAPIMADVLKVYGSSKNILGVCLGHQAIGTFYGAQLIQLPNVIHGIEKSIEWNNPEESLFRDISKPMAVGVYHSWVLEEQNFPPELEIIAKSSDGLIMAIRHKTNSVFGIQFHPESYLTPMGSQLISNWLKST
ncbi:MAG: aminodeoxychorismate/anthranilate synthase component II [Saprospiraceae bacterium]